MNDRTGNKIRPGEKVYLWGSPKTPDELQHRVGVYLEGGKYKGKVPLEIVGTPDHRKYFADPCECEGIAEDSKKAETLHWMFD